MKDLHHLHFFFLLLNGFFFASYAFRSGSYEAQGEYKKLNVYVNRMNLFTQLPFLTSKNNEALGLFEWIMISFVVLDELNNIYFFF